MNNPIPCALCNSKADKFPCPKDYIDKCACSNQECIESIHAMFLDIWDIRQTALLKHLRTAFDAGVEKGYYGEKWLDPEAFEEWHKKI